MLIKCKFVCNPQCPSLTWLDLRDVGRGMIFCTFFPEHIVIIFMLALSVTISDIWWCSVIRRVTPLPESLM